MMFSAFGLELSWGTAVWAVAVFLLGFALSTGAVVFLLVKLPATFFRDSHSRVFLQSAHPALRWAGLIGKNLIGYFVIVLGMALTLPGIPGQGLLMILVGIMLLDFPGKRRLVKRLLGVPRVIQGLNWLRHRFGKPPLVLDGTPRCRTSAKIGGKHLTSPPIPTNAKEVT